MTNYAVIVISLVTGSVHAAPIFPSYIAAAAYAAAALSFYDADDYSVSAPVAVGE